MEQLNVNVVKCFTAPSMHPLGLPRGIPTPAKPSGQECSLCPCSPQPEHPKAPFPSSRGDRGDQASGCVPVLAHRCQGRSDPLAMQGSLASVVSKGALEHVAVLFAQEQPGAPG